MDVRFHGLFLFILLVAGCGGQRPPHAVYGVHFDALGQGYQQQEVEPPLRSCASSAKADLTWDTSTFPPRATVSVKKGGATERKLVTCLRTIQGAWVDGPLRLGRM